MANIVHEFVLLKNLNSNGWFFPTGTVITTSLIPSSSGPTVVVEIDGVQKNALQSPESLGIRDDDFRVTKDTGYQYCDGTSLAYCTLPINPPFPYSELHIKENAVECQLEPVVCDIHHDSPTEVTNETGEGIGDGTITVHASGSNGSLHYSLSDIQWPEGQESNVFTGLSAGSYTIYMVDQYNCRLTQTVTVGVSSGSEVKFRAEWQDMTGNLSRFDIHERGYAGAVTEITTGPTPFICRKPYQDIQDIFVPVHPSSANLTAVSDSDFKYRDIFTQDDRKYSGSWYKDTGAGLQVKWKGYMKPSVFSEPYIHVPYDTSLTFIDGLETLTAIPFVGEDENKIEGTLSIIKIISFILKKLDLDLGIRSGINIYDSGMAITDADDPLAQAYHDAAIFYDEKGKSWNCHEVLTEVLKPFGARIKQWEGYWWITRIQEEHATFDYREFDVNGDYVTFGTYSPLVNIDQATAINRAVFLNRDALMEMIPGYGRTTIINHLNEIGNLLKNGTFDSYVEAGTGISSFRKFNYWTLNLNGSSGNWRQEQLGDNNVLGISFSGDGNENNIFITSREIPFQYANSDKIRVSFDYGVDQVNKEVPFGILKFSLKIGENYLTDELAPDASGILKNQWSATKSYYTAKGTFGDSLSTFSEVFDLPAGGTTIETTAQLELYNWSVRDTTAGDYYTNTASGWNFPDVSGYDLGDLYTAYTINPNSIPVIVFGEVVFNRDTGNEWSLRGTVPASDEYDFMPNTKFYFDNVDIDLLPTGMEPPSEETITLLNSNNYKEKLEVELQLADLPDVYISNAKNIYNDYMRLSDGTPTGSWARDGVSESDTIQKILLKQYNKQYNTPSQKITGTITPQEQGGGGIDLGFNNSFLETFDNKIYYLNAMEIDDKHSSYNVELVELKESAGGSDGSGSSGFPNAFTTGFGSGFEVTYN